ncbi:MAG: hypothetical protein JWM11_2238 [Planctomycetaceae bacterium]|nr:hypothetical protein [Planctomycetaceae bacterium]
MTRVLLETELESRFAGLDEPVEVCDHSGRLIGYFHPVARDRVSVKELSPFTDEEIMSRCGQPVGRLLSDIMRDLQSQ